MYYIGEEIKPSDVWEKILLSFRYVESLPFFKPYHIAVAGEPMLPLGFRTAEIVRRTANKVSPSNSDVSLFRYILSMLISSKPYDVVAAIRRRSGVGYSEFKDWAKQDRGAYILSSDSWIFSLMDQSFNWYRLEPKAKMKEVYDWRGRKVQWQPEFPSLVKAFKVRPRPIYVLPCYNLKLAILHQFQKRYLSVDNRTFKHIMVPPLNAPMNESIIGKYLRTGDFKRLDTSVPKWMLEETMMFLARSFSALLNVTGNKAEKYFMDMMTPLFFPNMRWIKDDVFPPNVGEYVMAKSADLGVTSGLFCVTTVDLAAVVFVILKAIDEGEMDPLELFTTKFYDKHGFAIRLWGDNLLIEGESKEVVERISAKISQIAETELIGGGFELDNEDETMFLGQVLVKEKVFELNPVSFLYHRITPEYDYRDVQNRPDPRIGWIEAAANLTRTSFPFKDKLIDSLEWFAKTQLRTGPGIASISDPLWRNVSHESLPDNYYLKYKRIIIDIFSSQLQRVL